MIDSTSDVMEMADTFICQNKGGNSYETVGRRGQEGKLGIRYSVNYIVGIKAWGNVPAGLYVFNHADYPRIQAYSTLRYRLLTPEAAIVKILTWKAA